MATFETHDIVLGLAAPQNYVKPKPVPQNNVKPKPVPRKKVENTKPKAAPRKQVKTTKPKAKYACVYKATDLSCSDLSTIEGLKLSGCSVISRRLLVVEGRKTAVKKFNSLVMKRKKKQEKNIDGLWQGLVPESRFGKFSILHCGNDSAVRKFFVAHGASHYWDFAVN